jgi:hypothetical protein
MVPRHSTVGSARCFSSGSVTEPHRSSPPEQLLTYHKSKVVPMNIEKWARLG